MWDVRADLGGGWLAFAEPRGLCEFLLAVVLKPWGEGQRGQVAESLAWRQECLRIGRPG